jgi:SAM-dependent methyltransferase
MLAAFFDWNRRLSAAIEKRLPSAFTRHLHTSYKYLVANYLDRQAEQTVLDIGGGKTCPYLPFTKEDGRHTIIAMDIAEEELRQNQDLTLRVVANASARNLPTRPGKVDLITSRSTVEHLPDNRAFLRSCHEALSEGGIMIHTFPCKYAPFSVVNALLPNALTRRLMAIFHPEWTDECGFRVFYDHCSYREMRRLIEEEGYDLLHCELRYYQAIYYNFFVPLYLLMIAYDLALWAVNARNLCCQILFVARRNEQAATPARA